MHHQGDLLGLGSVWGYVEGGMGRVSFAIAEAALEAGAQLAAGVPVARAIPGEGVELECGEAIRAPVVVCNADPKRLLAMLADADGAVPADYRRRLERWDVSSPVMKLNVAMKRLPTFNAAADLDPTGRWSASRHRSTAARRRSRRRAAASRRSASASSTSSPRTTRRWRRQATT